MGIEKFEVAPSDFEEDLDKSSFDSATAYTLETARQKAKGVAASLMRRDTMERPDVLIAADTVVEWDGLVLEKPADVADAKRMLGMLSGNWHLVHTGVVVYVRRAPTASLDHGVSFVETTKVKMIELLEEDIDAYVASGEPFDKAGAYGIQGRASQFVEELSGDYFNVMGLPICTLSRELAKLHSGP